MAKYIEKDAKRVLELFHNLHNNTTNNLVKETGFKKNFIDSVVNDYYAEKMRLKNKL